MYGCVCVREIIWRSISMNFRVKTHIASVQQYCFSVLSRNRLDFYVCPFNTVGYLTTLIMWYISPTESCWDVLGRLVLTWEALDVGLSYQVPTEISGVPSIVSLWVSRFIYCFSTMCGVKRSSQTHLLSNQVGSSIQQKGLDTLNFVLQKWKLWLREN